MDDEEKTKLTNDLATSQREKAELTKENESLKTTIQNLKDKIEAVEKTNGELNQVIDSLTVDQPKVFLGGVKLI